MERLFYKKSTAILIVAMAIVLVFLLCMLLVTLTQYSSCVALQNNLEKMIEQAKTDEAAKQQLIEYKNSDEFVKEWAIKKGFLPKDTINYIENELGK